MLKKLYLIFIIIITLSCLSNNNNTYDKNANKEILISKKNLENKGKIEVYDTGNDVYYVLNWTSKSRVSLKVIGKYEEEIKSLKDKIISATGEIICTSQWSGTIEITSYKVIE